MLRFHGHEYVTVERPAEKRSRHGDRSAFTTFTAGPCSIAWSTAWSSVNEVNKYPIEATNRDVSLFFTTEPSIKFDDRVIFENSNRYRVVAIEPWHSRVSGRLMGVEVRVSGMETGGSS